jgi:hypothetical protein
MAKKGKQKNTVNKAKHTKLLNRKKNKIRKEKEAREQRLKEIVKTRPTKIRNIGPSSNTLLT